MKAKRSLLFLLLFFGSVAGSMAGDACGPADAGVCAPAEATLPFLRALQEETAAAAQAADSGGRFWKAGAATKAPVYVNKKLLVFYTYDCPHCRLALEQLGPLTGGRPGLVVEVLEVKRDNGNRRRLAAELASRGRRLEGFPTFIAGGNVLTGFSRGRGQAELKVLLDGLYSVSGQVPAPVRLPLLGEVDPFSVPLLWFSFLLGLLDGLNPCAMWVLMFLMGLLVYTGSQKRMLLTGAIFVAASALVYFAFMAAWFNLFLVVGSARWITAGLGAVAVLMGLVNLKEIFFFRRGVSLMITDGDKLRLAGKIRRVMTAHGTAALVAGTVLLAGFVNLIELGCTMGLPAVFTRVLAVRQAGIAEKYWYMAVYNIAYIIPLAMIVLLFVFTAGRYKMTERHGKILKGISGALMLALGLIMVLRPEVLMIK